MTKSFIALILGFSLLTCPVWAKRKKVRDVQEVNFAEIDINGKVRNPDGAFLVQKRGINFKPLYEVKKGFENKIDDSVFYLEKQ